MSKLRFVGVSLVLLAIGIGFGSLMQGAWGSWGGPLVDVDVEVSGDREARSAVAQNGTEFEWEGVVRPGQVLEVKGVNGSIRAQAADGRQARVEAEKRGRRSDPSEVRIEVVEHAGGVTICAVYPSRDGENRCEAGDGGRNSVRNNDVKVEFTVHVPAGVDFAARTVNGEVEAEGLEGHADVSTVNGDLEVETSAGASARTVNGSIFARLGSTWDQDLEIETVNGSIEIDVPDDAGAEVDASWVNGSLEIEPPLSLRGRMSRRSAEGVLGAGGPELELKTVNGSIRVHE